MASRARLVPVVMLFIGTAAAAAPARPVHPFAPAVAATEQTPAAQAKATGREVEVPERTTPTTRVVALPGGAFRLTQHAVPVRGRTAAGWAPIDTTLERRGGVLRPKVAATPLTFSGGIDDVGMSTSSGWKVGWTNGQNGAFSAEVVVKLNSDSAADVGGGVSLSRTATLDVGVYSVGSTVEEDLNNREIDSSTQVGRDIKFRGNTGNQEMMINVGRNDGYDSRWGEIDFPDDGGVCNWNVC